MGGGSRLAAGGFALALSCAQVLDLDDYEPNEPPNVASASSGAQGGAGADGGSGDNGGTSGVGGAVCELPAACGEPIPPPPVGECPDPCTSCTPEGVCEIACADCNGQILHCPPGFACQVTCTPGMCLSAIVECPSEHQCEVICDGQDACLGLELRCDNAPCQLRCVTSAFACRDAQVTCGCNYCSGLCDFVEATLLPTFDCADSCECSPCVP